MNGDLSAEAEEGEINGELNPSRPVSPEAEKRGAGQAKQQTLTKGKNGGFVNVYGKNASPAVTITANSAIRQIDVQALLLWILADGQSPRWAFVKNKPLISKVVVLALPGMDAHTFLENQEDLPSFAVLGSPIATQAATANIRPALAISQFFHAPLTKKRKRDQYVEKKEASDKRKMLPPEHYRVTLTQMEANCYPLPEVLDTLEVVCPAGYVATQSREGAGNPRRLVAMDCEMCKTEAGDELTRVSLVDDTGAVLMDELVKPHLPITDYVTAFSGITHKMLENVETRLADVQRTFLQLVDAETLLVGHALENDLRAMRVIHANIIDTSIMYPHPKGPPFKTKLRILASQFLKRQIQNGSHDSIDDARAAMDLANLKFKHGPLFGTKESEELGERILEIFAEKGKRCTLVDRKDFLDRNLAGTASAVLCTNDETIVEKAAREAGKPGVDFVWAQLRCLNNVQDQRAQRRRKETLGDISRWTPYEPTAQRPSASGFPPVQTQQNSGTDSLATPATPAAEGRGPSADAGPACAPAKMGGQAATPATPPCDAPDVEFTEQEAKAKAEALKMFDDAVKRVWEQLPASGLLMVMTCMGDTPEVRRLRELRYKRMQHIIGPPWNPKAEEQHCNFERRHICGLTFCAVKQPTNGTVEQTANAPKT